MLVFKILTNSELIKWTVEQLNEISTFWYLMNGKMYVISYPVKKARCESVFSAIL